jgi:hypothetical protein
MGGDMSIARRDEQTRKREALFLQGPVRFSWIKLNIPDPASRLILVAEAFMKMKTPPLDALELRKQVWACAGISGKDRRSRVLAKIDQSVPGYAVERKAGGVATLRRVRNT